MTMDTDAIYCQTHPEVEPVVFCPACRGSLLSARKAEASRENGKKGGRPRVLTDAQRRERNRAYIQKYRQRQKDHGV